MIVEIERTEQIIDFAWELSRDSRSATYPREESKAELAKSLARALNSEHQRIIAYYGRDDELQGVCVYHWDSEENYSQASHFLINAGSYSRVADEFISFLAKHLGGYDFLIGVPAANSSAIGYFEQRGFACIESSIDTRLYNLQPPQVTAGKPAEKITADNLVEYAAFHDKFALPAELYYHSKNLKRYLEHFRILALRKNGKICGSIFARILPDNGADIVGLFSDGDVPSEKALINQLLLALYNEFGALDEVIFFIDEGSGSELDLALGAGFKIKDRYRLYRQSL